MEKHKQPKRPADDRPDAPGQPSEEPERRYPDSNRPDTLRPGPGQREEQERPKDEGRTIATDEDEDLIDDEDFDDDDEDLDDDDDDIDDEPMPARPVK